MSHTPRQQKIMYLTASGFTLKEIAAELGISIPAVDKTRKMLAIRYGCRNTTHLVAVMISKCVINPGLISKTAAPDQPTVTASPQK